MKKTIISIIVPVYNVEKYLSKCIDSLINQTIKNIEIILVNDGSTDNSLDIMKKYEKKHNNIVCIDKENGGQASARNKALTEAKGKYVTFVDSDDWIAPDMCEKLLNKAQEDQSDLVFASYYKVESGNEIPGEIYGMDEEDILKKYLLTQSGPCHKLIKKSLIIDNKLYFPEIKAYEDISIVPVWGLYANKVSCVNENLYYYLIREGSTMKQTTYNPKLEAIFVSLENLLDKYNKVKEKEQYHEEIEWIFIEHLLHGASLRFFQFNNYKENIKKINKIISEKFPNWRKNKYYQKQSVKYKIVCTLFYKEYYRILKLLLKNK